jgi:hypothetical protein
MMRDFSVMAARSDDRDAVAEFLQSCNAYPSDQTWQRTEPLFVGGKRDANEPEKSSWGSACIAVDRTGAVRGFCIWRRFHHPTYRDLFDVPILIVEKSPNSDEIARAIFDHLAALARGACVDAIRFLRFDATVWDRLHKAREQERVDVGVIMPLSADEGLRATSPHIGGLLKADLMRHQPYGIHGW